MKTSFHVVKWSQTDGTRKSDWNEPPSAFSIRLSYVLHDPAETDEPPNVVDMDDTTEAPKSSALQPRLAIALITESMSLILKGKQKNKKKGKMQ